MIRKIVAAASFGLVLGIAGASNPAEQSPEARAYLGFSFGGERIEPRDFHYGLRLDHDARFLERPVPPLMQIDFTRHGLNAARVNGLNVVRQRYQLRQAEEAAPAEEAPAEAAPTEEAPAEEVPAAGAAEGGEAAAEGSGFWGGIGNFFGGLFGSDEESPVETTAAEAPAEEAAGDDVTEGTFLNYDAIDWGLLAVGVVGLGVAAGEISNGDESADVGGGTAGGAAGGPAGGAAGGLPGGTPGGTLGGLAGGLGGLPGGLSGYTAPGAGTDLERDAEYRKWLDGGTGQMGDLGG